MGKPVSRSAQNQNEAVDCTFESLETEQTATSTDYTRELLDLRERNSALIEHIANLRGRNKELATAEELTWVQEAQIKKLRETETKLNSEVSRLRAEFEKQKNLVAADKNSVERLQKTLRAQESELHFAHENELSLKNEITRLRAECAAMEAKVAEGLVALKALENAFNEQKQAVQKARDEYNRTIAKITDASWAKDLEIDRLQKSESVLSNQLNQLGSDSTSKIKELLETREAYNRLQKEFATLQKNHAVSEAELNSIKSNSERKFNDMFKEHVQKSESLYGAHAQLNEEVRRLRHESSDYRNQLKAAQDEVSSLKSAASTHALQMQHTRLETERQVALLKAEQALQLTAKEAEIENAKDAAERKIARLGQHFELEVEKHRASEDKFSAQINELRTERATQTRLLKDANSTITELNKKLEENQVVRQKLESQVQELSQQQKTTSERFHTMEVSLKSELAKLNGEIALKSRMLEEQQVIAAEVVSLRSTQLEFTKLKGDFERQSAQVTDLQNRLADELKQVAQLKKAKAELSKLEVEFTAQKQQAAELQKNLEQKMAQIQDVADEALTLRHLVEDQTKRLEIAKTEIATLKQNIRQGFETRNTMTELERERLEKWSSQLSVREQQLRHYATSLNKEKTDLKGFSKQIAGEIQMVSKTHPLKDYLKATEFELSKVELQLKTTPTLSPERARLESAVGQLMEQREFLKAILVSAQAQFEGQIATLEKIVQNGKMAPVPPPPPSPEAPKVEVAAQTKQVNVQWENPMQDLK